VNSLACFVRPGAVVQSGVETTAVAVELSTLRSIATRSINICKFFDASARRAPSLETARNLQKHNPDRGGAEPWRAQEI